MPTVTARLALMGEKLTPVEHALVEVKEGVVRRIEEAPDAVRDPDHDVLLPAPFDPHVHSADWAFRHAGLGKTLRDVVAPPDGLKHRLMRETPERELEASIASFLRVAKRFGCIGVADFREGGVKGVRIGLSAADAVENITYIPMGRPTRPDPEVVEEELKLLADVTEYVGLPDVHLPDDVLEAIRDSGLRIYVHANEDPSSVKRCLNGYGTTEVERAIELLDPEGLIHLTVLTERDVDALLSSDVDVIVACPRSNSYFGVGEPDFNTLKRLPQRLLLGTDNGMTMEPDPFEEARYAWLRGLPPSRALRAITVDPASVFGLPTLEGGELFGALALDGIDLPWETERREVLCAHVLQAVKWADVRVYVGDSTWRATGS